MERAQARKRFLAGWQRIQGLCQEWDDTNESSRSNTRHAKLQSPRVDADTQMHNASVMMCFDTLNDAQK